MNAPTQERIFRELLAQYGFYEVAKHQNNRDQILERMVLALTQLEIARHSAPPAPTGAMATPVSLKRYEPEINSQRGAMDEVGDGDWVAYADVLPILAALRNLYRVHADWNNVSKRAEALSEAKRVLGL